MRLWHLATALVLMVPTPGIAQQMNGPAEGTQDIAPAGGLSTQQGVVTEPTLCPDGTEPKLKQGEAASPAKPGAELHYVCPDGSEITVGSGADREDSPSAVETPTMK